MRSVEVNPRGNVLGKRDVRDVSSSGAAVDVRAAGQRRQPFQLCAKVLVIGGGPAGASAPRWWSALKWGYRTALNRQAEGVRYWAKFDSSRDANQTAFDAVQQIIQMGEADGKNPMAVVLGRLGGLKGGRARAEKLTDDERRASAVKAANARWARKEG